MINFVRLGAKTNSYLKDVDSEDKTAKGNKMFVIKKNRKILIIFDDMIADMLSNKKRNPIVN